MSIAFKPEETFRGDYSYRNSDAAILRFPFPFPEDKYMYSVNIEPHVRSGPATFSCGPSMWMSTTSPNAATGPSPWSATPAAARCCPT